MSRITAVGTAVPSYPVTQEEARQFAKEMFGRAFHDIDRLLRVFDNAHIQKRHFSVPMDWFFKPRSFREKNDTYIRVACDLAEEAIRTALSRGGVTASQIDHLIFVSTTGISTPSIDARLANRLHMSPHLKRTPIWGLGCAGGAVGLSRAYEYTQAFPKHRVLLVTLELCSLTFQRNDLSKSNLIATSLFADGAAAAIVSGEEVAPGPVDGPHIQATLSTLWENTEDVMGWSLADDGWNVVFSKDIPTIVRTSVLPNIQQFLDAEQVSLAQIDHYVTHPGGLKVIQAYEEALALPQKKMKAARKVLQQYGNMSSASVLFVLAHILSLAEKGDYGIMTALGPGFSSEQLLLQW